MGDAAARLAEYRQRRREEEQAEARSEALWSTLTLQPLRRRLATRLDVAPEVTSEDHQDEGDGEEAGEEEPVAWTRLDCAILAMKLLVYGCLQILFIKLEFGAVFFLGSGVVALWWSLEDRKRRTGEKSAYSVFNPGCEAIHGTITSKDLLPSAK